MEQFMDDRLSSMQADARFQQLVARFQLLSDTTFALAKAGLDYQHALDLVAQRTAELIGDRCVIQLLSDDGQWLMPTAYYHSDGDDQKDQPHAATTYAANRGPTGHVIQTGQSLLYPTVTPEQQRTEVGQEFWPYQGKFGVYSLLIVPLRTEQRVIGTLSVSRDTADYPYTLDDQSFLEEIAERAALTIENAQLFYASQRLLDERNQALALLNTALISAPLGIALLDRELRYLRINVALAALHGILTSELLGKTIHEVLPDFAPLIEPSLQRVIETGEQLLDQEVNQFINLIQREWLISYYPIQLENGQIVGVGMIATDITERKRIEIARDILLRAEQKARADAEKAWRQVSFLAQVSTLLSSSLDYKETLNGLTSLIVPAYADTYVLDLLDSEDGTLRRAAFATTHLEHETTLREITEQYAIDLKSLTVREVLKTQQPILTLTLTEADYTAIAQDDTHLSLLRRIGTTSQVIVPISVRGEALGVMTLAMTDSGRQYGQHDLALMQDLAQRLGQAVDNARLYQQAQQGVNLRDEFMSIAAHELSTPITSLRGFAQVLLRRLSKDGTADLTRLQHGLEQIEQQSVKLTTLISQLLDVSRLQAGRLSLNMQPSDLIALVKSVRDTVQNTTHKHRLSLHAPDSVPIVMDALRMEQVLINLITNAVKYSPHGGEIEIEVDLQPEAILVSITDHGIGIPPEHRAHIFERFYQAHRIGYGGGMGLGLYISRQIVELHGGTLMAEYPNDAGTRMTVKLPRPS
jgi:PAS domain S-box-containing protein